MVVTAAGSPNSLKSSSVRRAGERQFSVIPKDLRCKRCLSGKLTAFPLLIILLIAVIVTFALGIVYLLRSDPKRFRRSGALFVAGAVLAFLLAALMPLLVWENCGCGLSGFHMGPVTAQLNLQELNLSESALENVTENTFRLVWRVDNGTESSALLSRQNASTLAMSDASMGRSWGWSPGSSRTIQVRLEIRSNNSELASLDLFGAANRISSTFRMTRDGGELDALNETDAIVINDSWGSELRVSIGETGEIALRIQGEYVCC